jgi:prophage DNA circulation protein
MGAEKQRTRVRSKIDDLPKEIKLAVEEMISDTRFTYLEISEYLKEKGYDVSYGAVFRYARRIGQSLQRLLESQQRFRGFMEVLDKNPGMDFTEAALQITGQALIERITSTTDEEWDALPIYDAIAEMTKVVRAKTYKTRVDAQVTDGSEMAYKQLNKEVYKVIETKHPELYKQIMDIARDVKDKEGASEKS